MTSTKDYLENTFTMTKQIKAVWHYPFNRNDTLKATVTKKENELILDGTMGTRKIRMELLKTDPPKYP